MWTVIGLMLMWVLNFYVWYCLGWTRRDIQILKRQSQVLKNFRDAETDEAKSEALTSLLEIAFKDEDEPYLIQGFHWVHNKLKRKPVDEAKQDGTE